MQGDVTCAKLGYIVRDHDRAAFELRKEMLRHIAARLNETYGEGTVELTLRDSYLNMLEKIQPHFHLIENARKATLAVGLTPDETPIRGGQTVQRFLIKGCLVRTWVPADSISTDRLSASRQRKWIKALRSC